MESSFSPRVWGFARTALWAALLAHCSFLVLFALINAHTLVLVNILSIGVYAYCIYLANKEEKLNFALKLVQGEVIAHAVIASWFLGLGSGFHFYLFLLAGWGNLILVNQSYKTRIIQTSVLALPFFLLEIIWSDHLPALDITNHLALIFRMSNIGLLLLMSLVLGSQYARIILSNEESLRDKANMDSLTHVYNRNFLRERLHLAPGEGQMMDKEGTVLMIDLDFFKRINDVYGHSVGDSVLQAVAHELKDSLRPGDCVVRWGGEEFLVILFGVNLLNAATIAERMRNRLEQLHFDTVKGPANMSATFGLSAFRSGDRFDDVVNEADSALYHGKRTGRNRVAIFKNNKTEVVFASIRFKTA